MQYRLTVKYVRGVKNVTPYCLSGLFQDATVQEKRENEPQMMHDRDDIILSVTTRSCTKRASPEDDTTLTDLILPPEPDVDAHASDTDVKVGNTKHPIRKVTNHRRLQRRRRQKLILWTMP